MERKALLPNDGRSQHANVVTKARAPLTSTDTSGFRLESAFWRNLIRARTPFACAMFVVMAPCVSALTYKWEVISLSTSMATNWDDTKYGASAHKNFSYGWADLAGGPLTDFSANQEIPALSDIPFVFVLNTDSTYDGSRVPFGESAYARVGYSFNLWLRLNPYDSLGNRTAIAGPVSVKVQSRLYNGQISALGYAQSEIDLSFTEGSFNVISKADPATDSGVKAFDVNGSGPHERNYTTEPYELGTHYFPIYPFQDLKLNGEITLASAAWSPSTGNSSYARGNEVAFVLDLRTHTVPDEPNTLLLATLGLTSLGLLCTRRFLGKQRANARQRDAEEILFDS